MAHYAEIDENNIVKRVIVAERKFIESGAMGDSTNWKKTSYNTSAGIHYAPSSITPDEGDAYRKNYAGVGYIYDESRDAFIPPKEFPSWTLNETTCVYDPPIPMPVDGVTIYYWVEETQEWKIDVSDSE